MKTKPIKDLKHYFIKNRVVTNFLILSIGILLTILGATIFKENSIIETILMSIGTSVIASILITSLSLFYIYDNESKQEIYDEWGLVSIYRTRSEMNISTEESFKKMIKNYDVIAFGMKSLRDAKGDRFKEKVKRGLKIRILTINPESEFLKQRELEEKRNIGDMRKTIYDLIKWVDKLKELAPDKNNILIKFYNTMPLDHYCKQDDDLYLGPYIYGIESQQTISYQFDCYGKGFEYYSNYFEKIWNDTEVTTEIE